MKNKKTRASRSIFSLLFPAASCPNSENWFIVGFFLFRFSAYLHFFDLFLFFFFFHRSLFHRVACCGSRWPVVRASAVASVTRSVQVVSSIDSFSVSRGCPSPRHVRRAGGGAPQAGDGHRFPERFVG